MQKILLTVATVAVILTTSCSKKDSTEATTTTTTTNTNTVTINGTDYPTVKIGSKTWTAVNYNGAGGVNYNNGANDPKYGKLYSLAEAKVITLPTGWRLPTTDDFINLATVANNNVNPVTQGLSLAAIASLKSKTDWTVTNGTNSTGFNAYPTGHGFQNAQLTFEDKGEQTQFATSSRLNDLSWSKTDTYPAFFYIQSYISTTTKTVENDALLGAFIAGDAMGRFSLRFVKDN